MDEADMYKQRLEAIAEKLQLQEEQERARREMGEERLRLQQLKRKSLRDQWLMEGAPLSPASLDTQSPRSPLWGSETQEMEEHIDQYCCGLRSESQQLTEEEEKEPMKNRKMQEAAKMEEADAESGGDGVRTNQSLQPDKTTTLLPNDRGEGATSPDSSDNNQSSSSGPVAALASGDRLRTSVSEGEPAPNPSFSVKEEETVVMITERVIVTDEEDEELEVIEGQLKGMQSETNQERQEAVEEEIKREAAGEKHKTTQHTAETSPTPAGGEEKRLPVSPLGVTVVSTVPVYSQAKSDCEQEADGSAAATREGADSSSETEEPPPLPGQFQEVFLVDPQNDKCMEGMLGEQDCLLPQAKAPDSNTEPAAADLLASTEARSPNRASHKEKSKTSLCCTVM